MCYGLCYVKQAAVAALADIFQIKIWTLSLKLNPLTSLVFFHHLLLAIQREFKDPHVQGKGSEYKQVNV